MSLPALPTLEELLHPATQPKAIADKAAKSDDPLDPIHLFNMTWRKRNGMIPHLVLPSSLTGVDAKIVVMSARHFPTGSVKVGPAFSCLRERIFEGDQIDPNDVTLVFPSTGNYGIGGAWVGPRVGFKSMVVLPEEMSAERFEKIRGYGADVIATPGCESNVKEIYDKVNELKQDDKNVILNQFAEFGNYRFHHHVTGGAALELAAELGETGVGNGKVAAFVSAMGSAGTLCAADRIKKDNPHCRAIGVEPIQCPTLYNVGYGGHAIEGIGDKHVTWIHNVRNTDMMVCVDDQQCLEGLQVLQEGGADLTQELGVDESWAECVQGTFGVSGVCNIIAAIKTAKFYEFGQDDVILTVATDGFDRYPSVLEKLTKEQGPQTPELLRRRLEHFRSADLGWCLEGTLETRKRWHNQKYFTWVEQQGMSVDELNALWSPEFWEDHAERIPELDKKVLAARGEQ